jgi:choline dehydrogenase
MNGAASRMRSPDVLLVGAGTAGCVAAARLLRQGGTSVLMVEAGSDDAGQLARLGRLGRIPPEHDWQVAASPGLPDRFLRLPRGRAVGGTSLIQGGVALRSHASDYDAWALAAGTGGSFPQVLPRLRALETDADFADEWHGRDGPLHIQRPRPGEWQPLHSAFAEACLQQGAPWCDDLNRPAATGVGPVPLAQRDGVRETVRGRFLDPVRARPELALRPGTRVTRLLCDGRRAIGAEVVDGDGRRERIHAGQVAVCAGALGTPALLLHSGIGPPEELTALGIPVVAELPGVGRELRDHPALVLELSQERGHGSPSPLWFQVMLRHLDGAVPGLPDCALEVYHDFFLGDEALAHRRSRLAAALLGARGAGRVRLRSADPDEPPSVELAYQDPRDLADLARVLAFTLDLAGTPAFARLGPRNVRLLKPAGSPRAVAAEAFRGLSEQASAAALGEHVTTAHHFHGSCAMGPSPAAGAVVDSAFRVHGLENLYVGDASVIPVQFRANTHLVSILVGEWLGGQLAGEPAIFQPS